MSARMETLSFRVPASHARKLRKLAKRLGKQPSDLLRAAVAEFLYRAEALERVSAGEMLTDPRWLRILSFYEVEARLAGEVPRDEEEGRV